MWGWPKISISEITCGKSVLSGEKLGETRRNIQITLRLVCASWVWAGSHRRSGSISRASSAHILHHTSQCPSVYVCTSAVPPRQCSCVPQLWTCVRRTPAGHQLILLCCHNLMPSTARLWTGLIDSFPPVRCKTGIFSHAIRRKTVDRFDWPFPYCQI